MKGVMLGKAHAHVVMFGKIFDQHSIVVTNDLVVVVIDLVSVRDYVVDEFPIWPLSFDKMSLMVLVLVLGLAVIAIYDVRVGSRSIIEIVVNAR